MKRKTSWINSVLVLIPTALGTSLAAAQTLPNAGTLLERPAEKSAADKAKEEALRNAEIVRPNGGDSGGALPPSPSGVGQGEVGTLIVSSFELLGADGLPKEEIEKLLQPFSQKRSALPELHRTAALVEQYLREKEGLIAAKAWVPLQNVKAGVVQLRVLPGVLGEVRLSKDLAADRVSTKVLALAQSKLQADGFIKQSELEALIFSVADYTGFVAKVVLVPTATLGKYDVMLEADAQPKVRGSISIDNTGNRYTSTWRDSSQVAIRDTLFAADSLSLSGQVLTSAQKNLRLRYVAPLGTSGYKLGATAMAANYRLGGDFTALEAKGDTHIGGIDLSKSLVRSRDLNLTASAEVQNKRLRNNQLGAVTSDRHIQSLQLGLRGDGAALGGYNSGGFTLTSGRANLSNVAADALADSTSTNIQGAYRKLVVNFGHSHALDNSTYWQANFSTQAASKNLDSSESFLLGGLAGVRAYAGGEAASDAGSVLNLELHSRWNAQWRSFSFYDHGWAKIRHTPLASAAALNNYQLNAIGLGVVWSPTQNTDIGLTVASKIKNNPAANATTGADSDGRSSRSRAWLALTQRF